MLALEMPDEVSIRVNFNKPIPLFPLDSVVLLPQQVMPLHIFEERYRQMVREALDGPGQIAMAMIRPGRSGEYHGNPPLMPAVCVGHIEQHETLPDGRYNILLRGVCRARIVSEEYPDDDRLYRRAFVDPLGISDEEHPEADSLRDWLGHALLDTPLSKLTVADQVRSFVTNDEVPTPVLLEMVSFAIVSDSRVRYRLLAERDLAHRVEILRSNLEGLQEMIGRALSQRPESWPKGCSWN